MQTLTCPITLQCFRKPVVASDGHVYEESAIHQWIKKYARSPITQGPINLLTYPCIFVKQSLDSMESQNQFFYMKRYQFSIKEWLDDYIEKYGIMLTNKQKQFIDLESFDQLFIELKIHHHVDKIDINSCKMPDRIMLYDFLFDHMDIKKVIKETSPNDPGLSFYFSKITNAPKFYHDPDDPKFFDLIDPSVHYKLLDYHGFFHCIQRFDTTEQLNDFVVNDLKYFNECFHPYTLHCFLSNHKLLNVNVNVEEYIDIMNNIMDNIICSECVFSVAPNQLTIVGSLDFNQESVRLKSKQILNHLIQKKHREFVDNLNKDDIFLICKYIDQELVSRILGESSLNLDDEVITHLFKNLNKFLCGSDALIDWLIYKNINLNELYDGKTIFSHYLSDINFVGHNVQVISLCQNIEHFIKHNIMVDEAELNILANIIMVHKKNMSEDLLMNLYLYVANNFNSTESHIQYIVCVIIKSMRKINDSSFLCNLIKNYDVAKKYPININGIQFSADYSMLRSILACPLISIDMIILIIQKYGGFHDEWLEYLLKNPVVTGQMLEILPKNIKITDKVLKNAANNKSVNLGMLRNLINKI